MEILGGADERQQTLTGFDVPVSIRQSPHEPCSDFKLRPLKRGLVFALDRFETHGGHSSLPFLFFDGAPVEIFL